MAKDKKYFIRESLPRNSLTIQLRISTDNINHTRVTQQHCTNTPGYYLLLKSALSTLLPKESAF